MKPVVIGFRFFIIQELFYMTTGHSHLQGIPLALPLLSFLCTPLFITENLGTKAGRGEVCLSVLFHLSKLRTPSLAQEAFTKVV